MKPALEPSSRLCGALLLSLRPPVDGIEGSLHQLLLVRLIGCLGSDADRVAESSCVWLDALSGLACLLCACVGQHDHHVVIRERPR